MTIQRVGDGSFFVPYVDAAVVGSPEVGRAVAVDAEAVQEVSGSAPRLSWPLAGLGANPHDAVVAGGDEGGVLGRPYDPGDVSGVAGDECVLFPRPSVPDFQLLVGTPAG